mgnify:CR=1 FL=1
MKVVDSFALTQIEDRRQRLFGDVDDRCFGFAHGTRMLPVGIELAVQVRDLAREVLDDDRSYDGVRGRPLPCFDREGSRKHPDLPDLFGPGKTPIDLLHAPFDLSQRRLIIQPGIYRHQHAQLVVSVADDHGVDVIDRIGDPLYEAFLDTGLWPPTELNAVPRTIFQNTHKPHLYDQIAWFSTPEGGSLLDSLTYTGRAGGFDFLPHVYSERTRTEISWRISDHYPLWVEFEV